MVVESHAAADFIQGYTMLMVTIYKLSAMKEQQVLIERNSRAIRGSSSWRMAIYAT